MQLSLQKLRHTFAQVPVHERYEWCEQQISFIDAKDQENGSKVEELLTVIDEYGLRPWKGMSPEDTYNWLNKRYRIDRWVSRETPLPWKKAEVILGCSFASFLNVPKRPPQDYADNACWCVKEYAKYYGEGEQLRHMLQKKLAEAAKLRKRYKGDENVRQVDFVNARKLIKKDSAQKLTTSSSSGSQIQTGDRTATGSPPSTGTAATADLNSQALSRCSKQPTVVDNRTEDDILPNNVEAQNSSKAYQQPRVDDHQSDQDTPPDTVEHKSREQQIADEPAGNKNQEPHVRFTRSSKKQPHTPVDPGSDGGARALLISKRSKKLLVKGPQSGKRKSEVSLRRPRKAAKKHPPSNFDTPPDTDSESDPESESGSSTSSEFEVPDIETLLARLPTYQSNWTDVSSAQEAMAPYEKCGQAQKIIGILVQILTNADPKVRGYSSARKFLRNFLLARPASFTSSAIPAQKVSPEGHAVKERAEANLIVANKHESEKLIQEGPSGGLCVLVRAAEDRDKNLAKDLEIQSALLLPNTVCRQNPMHITEGDSFNTVTRETMQQEIQTIKTTQAANVGYGPGQTPPGNYLDLPSVTEFEPNCLRGDPRNRMYGFLARDLQENAPFLSKDDTKTLKEKGFAEKERTRWMLLGIHMAISDIHQDHDGAGTYFRCVSGFKIWMWWPNMKEDEVIDFRKHGADYVGGEPCYVMLAPGDEFYMTPVSRPCAHAVLTIGRCDFTQCDGTCVQIFDESCTGMSLVEGGHYWHVDYMSDTIDAITDQVKHDGISNQYFSKLLVPRLLALDQRAETQPDLFGGVKKAGDVRRKIKVRRMFALNLYATKLTTVCRNLGICLGVVRLSGCGGRY